MATSPRDFPLQSKKTGPSFTEKLDGESLKFFSEVASRPFAQQAVAFLNAYWPEAKDEAEFIYSVAWDVVKYADMNLKEFICFTSTTKVLMSILTLDCIFMNNFASFVMIQKIRNGDNNTRDPCLK